MNAMVDVALEPRFMGVPGTQLGLRSQLRTILCTLGPGVTCKDICRIYVSFLKDLIVV